MDLLEDLIRSRFLQMNTWTFRAFGRKLIPLFGCPKYKNLEPCYSYNLFRYGAAFCLSILTK
jgi:hypothetical protein